MKKLIIWINITSVALIITGLIHLAAAVMVFPMFKNLPEGQFSAFIFMYLAAGLGTILPGLISRLQSNGLKEKNKGAWITLLVCSVYTIIIGIGAVIQMMDNIFAYIALIIGMSLLIPALLIKKHI